MDRPMQAAARALSKGDPLGALKVIALRNDPSALALRGVAMAQMGDLTRAQELLRSAIRGFAPTESLDRARSVVAEAEIALVSRDLGRSLVLLAEARAALTKFGDRANAGHAGYLQARLLLLLGRPDDAEAMLSEIDTDALPLPSRVGLHLVAAGIAVRRVQATPARAAMEQARQLAQMAAIPTLVAEVARASRILDLPAARQVSKAGDQPLRLEQVEKLMVSDVLLIDACRGTLRAGPASVPLSTRPVLFCLLRMLAESWPAEAERARLLQQAFGARHVDMTHRARLRVEIARLREAIEPLASLNATKRGFRLEPHLGREVVVLKPTVEGDPHGILTLLGDGESWSSSALGLALGISARSVQRALERLAREGRVECFGRGRARRWIAANIPGFPTSLLLSFP